MSQKGMLVALLLGCCGATAQADTLTRQLNWPATASKDTRMEIALTHPGLQPVNSNQTQYPIHTLAANISSPDFNTTYQLQARKLYGTLTQQAGTPISLTLNGQRIPSTHPLTLAQATRYYLSYQAPSSRPHQTGEAAYELMVYWHG
ncbi:hypothetical protein MM182_17510 [Aeromonas sp. MR19]|jgi:hypothetical protein|uniref:hypothetical protein n=1 Tax=Aeromonas TaxID=642 RepID=UPI001F4B3BC1|nr:MULTISPECIES: hypothetical protein [Aeromonas]EKP0278945.1 hypothetical protein [Aeromonas bestiarum]MCH7349652.1 hypothetical protein [Aeromonas sp. MR7]MCH7377156.1 hypothetical protein [Aeromonas sp. MR19]MDM5091044.1 hypothetical protein [Aeromonas bestiarum]WDL82719.1 hypothetical protein IU367_00340 [Aeromonas bestiarum]